MDGTEDIYNGITAGSEYIHTGSEEAATTSVWLGSQGTTLGQVQVVVMLITSTALNMKQTAMVSMDYMTTTSFSVRRQRPVCSLSCDHSFSSTHDTRNRPVPRRMDLRVHRLADVRALHPQRAHHVRVRG